MYRESTRNAPRHLYIARDGTVVARDEISGAVRWRSTLADRKNQVSSGKKGDALPTATMCLFLGRLALRASGAPTPTEHVPSLA
jgi:hypothetical protein